MKTRKAELLYYNKTEIKDRYITELTIFDVGKSDRYPDGLKYRLICIDVKTMRKVLMDNHHPKGHHIHIDNEQISYDYKSYDQLITDFEKIILENFGIKL